MTTNPQDVQDTVGRRWHAADAHAIRVCVTALASIPMRGLLHLRVVQAYEARPAILPHKLHLLDSAIDAILAQARTSGFQSGQKLPGETYHEHLTDAAPSFRVLRGVLAYLPAVPDEVLLPADIVDRLMDQYQVNLDATA